MSSYTLHIQYVDRPAETRTVTQPKVLIGRDAGDIILHDSQVSGRHGEITWDGTTLRFTDLGSTNGSFLLQGQRVANLDLTPGIALRLGNSLITVQTIEGVAAGPGKGRTVIAGPGMVPGFPAPMKNAPPKPGGPPAPGSFAFAPTAQMQPPSGLRPPAPQPGGAPPMPVAMPAPMAVPAPAQQPVPTPIAPMPAPMPVAPQPPGPPPGTLSGAQAQPAVPQPVAAAPVPVSPQPVAQPSYAPPTPSTPTGADDLGNAIKQIYGQAWTVLAPVVVTAVLAVAAVLVPLGLLGQLMLRILPLGLAGLLTMLLALAQLAAMIMLFPSLIRFLLGSYLGQPISIQAAVQQQTARAADVALNCFLPGIVLGVFAGPIYFVEGRKLGDVIGRNFNLLGKELVPIIVAIFAGGIVVGIGSAIVGYILGLLPFGWLLTSLFVNTLTSIMVAFGAALSVSLYFSVRRKHEGGDPEAEARERLAQGALPAA